MLRLVNALWFLLLASLILIAVYVSLGRHFLSVATQSPDDIEQLLEKVLQQPVSIKMVQGNWHFLSPSLTLYDLKVGVKADADDAEQRKARTATVSPRSTSAVGAAPGAGPPTTTGQDEAATSDAANGLRIGFLHVGVDVFRTLLAREVRLSFLHISGLKVGLYAANGRIKRIEGLNLLQATHAPQTQASDATTGLGSTNPLMVRLPRLLQNLLADKGLIFKEIQLTLNTPKQSQKFLAKQLSLVEKAGQYHIQAKLELLEGRPVVLSLHSIMQGKLMLPETWSGRFYADIDRTPSAQWLKHLPMLRGQLDSLDLGGAFWGEFEAASLGQLTGRVALYDLDYSLPTDGQSAVPASANSRGTSLGPEVETADAAAQKSESEAATVLGKAPEKVPDKRIRIPYASTQFHWVGEMGGRWRMRCQDVLVQGETGEFRPGDLFFASEQFSGVRHALPAPTEGEEASKPRLPRRGFRMQGQAFSIADFSMLVEQMGFLPAELVKKLKQAKPLGVVDEFEIVVLPAVGSHPFHWSVGAAATRLKWSKTPGLPGVSGLSATVIADQSGGAAALSLDQGSLDLRPNFREVIPLSHLSVPIQWHRDADGVHVSTGVALLKNEDALGAAMLAAQVPPPAISSGPTVSLIAGLTRGREQATVTRYLPTDKMPPGLVRWLDESLVSGLLESGHFVHEGPLAKFPYAAKTFQMRFLANDATVAYHPKWPPLTQARVDAFINRREGHFLVPSAKVYDADLRNGQVRLPYFDRGETAHLHINAQTTGGVEEGLRALRETPIREQLGAFIDDVAATGELGVGLMLDVPLRGKPKPSAARQAAGDTAAALGGASQRASAGGEPKASEVAQSGRDDDKKVAGGIEVTAKVDLQSVDLSMAPWNLSVDQLSGPVVFQTGKGLSSRGLKGVFLDQPVTAKIATSPLPGSQSNRTLKTEIGVSGRVSASALAAWQGLPIFTFLSGKTGYQAKVTLFPKILNRPPNVTIESDLSGVAVDLPAPVGKGSKTPADLMVSLDFGKHREIALLAKGQAALGMRFDPKGLSAVKVHLGSSTLIKPQTPGLVITGDTPVLMLAPWIEFIERYQKRVTVIGRENTSGQASGPAGTAGGKQKVEQAAGSGSSEFDWLSALKWVDISANALGYNEKLINQATVQVARIADVWQITLQGAEISGIISLPVQYAETEFLERLKSGSTSVSVRERMNARPIDLDIGFLALPEKASENKAAMPGYVTGPPAELARSESAPEASARGTEATRVQMADALRKGEARVLADGYRRLPPFNVRVRRLFRGDQALGSWSAQSEVTPLGLRVNHIKGSLHGVSFEGEGAWTASLGGGAASLVGRAFSTDLAASFSGFGFPPVIESKDAAIDLDLSWRGRPWDFDYLTAGGKLALAINDGTLLNINTTASTVRVIGLLNIEMLTRRMQLDFTDVLNKGMQFQHLGGKFNLREGMLLTDHVKLRGASAQFDISGQINLRAETIDTEMSVTLPVTRNLVLPAAATGGLPAAATAFVIEKALGDKIDKLTTMRFDVSGDWNDPQITRRRRQTTAQDNRPGR